MMSKRALGDPPSPLLFSNELSLTAAAVAVVLVAAEKEVAKGLIE